jgi:hypothetical protein
MGTRGPASKREGEALGHARVAKEAQLPVDKVEFATEIRSIEPDPNWCEIAKYAYRAFLESPLKQFHTETDVAFGWMTADAINTAYRDKSAMKIASAESMMRAALFSESDRRRVRIEVTHKEPESNPVAQQHKNELEERRRLRDAQ